MNNIANIKVTKCVQGFLQNCFSQKSIYNCKGLIKRYRSKKILIQKQISYPFEVVTDFNSPLYPSDVQLEIFLRAKTYTSFFKTKTVTKNRKTQAVEETLVEITIHLGSLCTETVFAPRNDPNFFLVTRCWDANTWIFEFSLKEPSATYDRVCDRTTIQCVDIFNFLVNNLASSMFFNHGTTHF